MPTKAELADENIELKLEIAKAHEALTELKAYLQSSKFHRDTTVQTADVLHRLEEVRLTPICDQVARWSAMAEEFENKELFSRWFPNPESLSTNG
jgi:hypothetical protein